jgi:hypothetical protein
VSTLLLNCFISDSNNSPGGSVTMVPNPWLNYSNAPNWNGHAYYSVAGTPGRTIEYDITITPGAWAVAFCWDNGGGAGARTADAVFRIYDGGTGGALLGTVNLNQNTGPAADYTATDLQPLLQNFQRLGVFTFGTTTATIVLTSSSDSTTNAGCIMLVSVVSTGVTYAAAAQSATASYGLVAGFQNTVSYGALAQPAAAAYGVAVTGAMGVTYAAAAQSATASYGLHFGSYVYVTGFSSTGLLI